MFCVMICFTGCDTLYTVSLSDQGYRTIISECGETRIVLTNGISADSYQLSIGTNYDANIDLEKLFIVFDADTVDEFALMGNYHGVDKFKTTNKIEYWHNFGFEGKPLSETQKLRIHLDGVLECNGNTSHMDDIILLPPKIWSK